MDSTTIRRMTQVDDIDFICEEPGNPAAQKTPELTGWELVVFELADEEEPRS